MTCLVAGCCGCNASAANNEAHACVHNFGEIYEFIPELIDVLCECFLIEMRARFQSHPLDFSTETAKPL